MQAGFCLIAAVALTGCVSVKPNEQISGANRFIDIRHLSPEGVTATLRDADKTTDLTPDIADDQAPAISIHRAQKPKFLIKDPNPILFTYKMGTVTSTETQTAQTASAIADALNTAVGGLKGARAPIIAGDCEYFEVQGVDVETFLETVSGVLAAEGQITSLIDQTLDQSEANLKALKDGMSDWQTTEWKKVVKSGLDAIEKIRERQRGNEGVEFAIPGRKPNCREVLTRAGFEKSGGPYVSRFHHFMDYRSDRKQLLDTLQALESLAAQAARVGVQQPLETTIQYSGVKVQTQPIIIGTSAEFSSYLSDKAKAVQKQRSGTYKLSVRPYEGIHLVPSIGAIYSFVKAPKFAANQNSSGQYVISQTSNEYTELGASVAANLVWDEFFGQPVEPFVQFGVSPDSENLAFLLGVGVRAVDRFTMSAGVAYQRVKNLSAGLQVGAVLASAEELKTESEYKSGLYLSLSYKLKE